MSKDYPNDWKPIYTGRKPEATSHELYEKVTAEQAADEAFDRSYRAERHRVAVRNDRILTTLIYLFIAAVGTCSVRLMF